MDVDRDLLERAAKKLAGACERGGSGCFCEYCELREAIESRLSTPAAEVLQATRPETGPMRFGTDWTGVFIRGDDAFAYANYIDQLLKVTIATDFVDTIARMNVESLARILLRAVERHETPKAQALRPFAECLSTIDSLAGVGK